MIPVQPRKAIRPAALIFTIALLTAFAMILIGWRSQRFAATTFDPYYFGAMGRSLAHGEGFTEYGLLLKRRCPLYPAMLGSIYLFAGDNSSLVFVIQAILFAGTCVLAFEIGRRLFNVRTGLIAGTLCAINPSLLRYVPDLHLEVLFTFLVTLTVWRSVRFYEQPSARNGALFGLSAALASLTKAVILFYPFLFLLLWGWNRRRATAVQTSVTRVWPIIAVAVGVMALVISPWTVRNYRVTGHFVPITTGLSDAFLRGYVFSKPDYALLRKPPYTFAENESNAWFREICARQGATWQANDLQTDKLLNQAAKEKLLSDPAEFVRKFSTGIFTFWYQMTSRTNSIIAGAPVVAAWILALVGWRRARREVKPAWVLFLPILYLNLLLAALLALGRYSVPILPCLMIMAAFGVDHLLRPAIVRRQDSGLQPEAC